MVLLRSAAIKYETCYVEVDLVLRKTNSVTQAFCTTRHIGLKIIMISRKSNRCEFKPKIIRIYIAQSIKTSNSKNDRVKQR